MVKYIVDDTVVRAAIVERQLRADRHTLRKKQRAWAAYTGNLYARLGVPVDLLVFCPTDDVAGTCGQPIRLTTNGCELRPLVIGPSGFPRITDPEQACQSPELAVLSLRHHARDPDSAVKPLVRAVDTALTTLDEDIARQYADYVFGYLNPAMQNFMEAVMETEERPYFGELSKRLAAR
ncbi:MAG: hypothetical protein ACRD0P_17215 [Stackebrandtia sp.]